MPSSYASVSGVVCLVVSYCVLSACLVKINGGACVCVLSACLACVSV